MAVRAVPVAIVGAGNMGTALARGLRRTPRADAPRVTLSGRDPARLAAIGRELGVRVASSNREAARSADLVVLAVKPQILPFVLEEVGPVLRPGATVLSIAAGVPTDVVAERLGGRHGVVRAMPNVAASVGASATAFCRGATARPTDVRRARELLARVGTVVEVDETLMDAVTGLSGTGPLYLFLILEGLSDAGVKVGLSRAVATELAIQTLVGAAQLVRATGEHPAKLRDLVTSPGGTAITALHSLERSGLPATLFDAVEAATNRAAELGRRWHPSGPEGPQR